MKQEDIYPIKIIDLSQLSYFVACLLLVSCLLARLVFFGFLLYMFEMLPVMLCYSHYNFIGYRCSVLNSSY